MPTGTFDLTGTGSGLSNPASQTVVYRYSSDANTLTLLPNVWCEHIENNIGAKPPVARFRYVLDDVLGTTFGWPTQYENIFPLNAAPNPHVVKNDDRLAVYSIYPGGGQVARFDGFAQIPQVDVSPTSQAVTFVAVGVASRLWDWPIQSRIQRQGDEPIVNDGSADVEIMGSCRFNPSDETIGNLGGYLGNATNVYTIDQNLGQYPVFLDPLLSLRGSSIKYWFVADAACYLIAYMINVLNMDRWVTFPTLATTLVLLTCGEPPDGVGPLNPAGAVTTNIVIRDYDATNKAFPEVIEQLLDYAGFVLKFSTTTGSDGFPQTNLVFMRRDALATAAAKPVFHAAAFSPTLDPLANSVTRYSLALDSNLIANQWFVETAPKQIEVTVYLCPLFQPVAGDEATPQNFYSSALTNATAKQRHMYRWYGVDECGDGFWTVGFQQFVLRRGFDFTPALNDGNGNPTFVKRYRPGQHTLISKDISGEPLLATLEITFDPTIARQLAQPIFSPSVPAASGTWLTVPHGWQLLDDRLGIEVSIQNPEQWATGNPAVGEGGDIRGITWQSNPPPGRDFILRLTTVIDDDARISAVAPMRRASPTIYARTRSVDAKDHFQYCSVMLGSTYYLAQGGNGADPLVARDDTADAVTHAEQQRSAHEFPLMAGELTIPWITTVYDVGDRISMVVGRNASLQTNIGAGQGEAPSYGWVVGIGYTFDPRQETTLKLSDLRSERSANL